MKKSRLVVLGLAGVALAAGLFWRTSNDTQRKNDEQITERTQVVADFASWNRCYATFTMLPDVAEKIEQLKKLNDSEQRKFIIEGGWAAGPDGKTTWNAATFCATEIRNRQREAGSPYPSLGAR